jgi:hypothetical protein
MRLRYRSAWYPLVGKLAQTRLMIFTSFCTNDDDLATNVAEESGFVIAPLQDRHGPLRRRS